MEALDVTLRWSWTTPWTMPSWRTSWSSWTKTPRLGLVTTSWRTSSWWISPLPRALQHTKDLPLWRLTRLSLDRRARAKARAVRRGRRAVGLVFPMEVEVEDPKVVEKVSQRTKGRKAVKAKTKENSTKEKDIAVVAVVATNAEFVASMAIGAMSVLWKVGTSIRSTMLVAMVEEINYQLIWQARLAQPLRAEPALHRWLPNQQPREPNLWGLWKCITLPRPQQSTQKPSIFEVIWMMTSTQWGWCHSRHPPCGTRWTWKMVTLKVTTFGHQILSWIGTMGFQQLWIGARVNLMAWRTWRSTTSEWCLRQTSW